jgi:DNA repair exonuclease SbcCD ATPase subunit
MDKAEPVIDPVEQATAQVREAERDLAELIAQHVAVTGREQRLTAERSKIAFAAHGSKNAKAKTRLSEIHRELAEIGSEVSSFTAAIDEARSRLGKAKQEVAREIEKRRCGEALSALDELLGHAHGIDSLLRQYVAEIATLDQCAQRVCAVAGRPDRSLLRVALNRSLSAALTAHRGIFENMPLLPPRERHPLSHWADAWAASIRATLAQRIAEPEAPRDSEEAA